MQFVNSFNAKLFHVVLESLVSTKLTKFYYCIKLINERQLLVKRSHMSHVSHFCGYLCEIEILASTYSTNLRLNFISLIDSLISIAIFES